jgi:hypothetical protein
MIISRSTSSGWVRVTTRLDAQFPRFFSNSKIAVNANINIKIAINCYLVMNSARRTLDNKVVKYSGFKKLLNDQIK